ncbi:glycosyl transferase, group 1 family protein [Renibacterium salmoninarum ATCC 33209]|uniref:Glycosyl transferase, group 1 family protein n=1 Tax=Renibacterium salmoninarum (strain ATCC 33209 / DSM 20767 / JCM 11484 / NBRC 15589 / NCIMB 2235) TaxID=288705 RepID=A9WN80_RENSM|nr:glycosyltransferase family 1 protein [Renibacterium salmoninarum]ABY23079.1 glycosyl transferase, group 1 family protein [Renibacterium salmoninarum ATCC 33209]
MSSSTSLNDSTAPDLRVAIPMLTLVPGSMGGGETYARGLMQGLEDFPKIKATTFVGPQAQGFSAKIDEVVCPEMAGGASNKDKILTLFKGLIHHSKLRRRIDGNDVYHVPFAVALPRPRKSMPMVQTLCDVQHRDLPHLFSRVEKIYRRFFYERTARKADALITISDFAKQTIIDHLGVSPEKIFTAYLAVETEAFIPNLGDRGDFIMYPARGWAHKNHAKLFEAMKILKKSHPDLTLVLTGGGLDELSPPDNVEVRGLVSFEELKDLYRTAKCMVFPSLYEGFGLPPLEAMASGCPVASSKSGALPEVVGDAAVLFDAESAESIAQGILEATERGAELQAKGLDRVKEFTWERCAAAHDAAYKFALNQRNQ